MAVIQNIQKNTENLINTKIKQLKRAKDLNIYLTKEVIQMANKHTKTVPRYMSTAKCKLKQ